MKLPEGVFYHPRQERLIAKDALAIIRIDTRHPGNEDYQIVDRQFEQDAAPCLHGDWKEFDDLYHLNRGGEVPSVIYSFASHESPKRAASEIIDSLKPQDSEAVSTTGKLPNITVVPNQLTSPPPDLTKPRVVLGTTMGHYHPPLASGFRVQEIYEFQSYGLMVLNREHGKAEIWVAKEGDKVAVPTGCHMALYNLGDIDNPLVTLDFANLDRNPSNKELVKKWGPILLAYYDDFEVVFTVNQLYVNNLHHPAGLRLQNPDQRQVRVNRGTRLNLGKFLHSKLTQDPKVIGQFLRLGLQLKKASPQTVLEPFPSAQGSRLYFEMPLVKATSLGSQVYRYFFPNEDEAEPKPPGPLARRPNLDRPLKRGFQAPRELPMMIVVEGAGDWVKKAFRNVFIRAVENGKRLAVYYADDTRWKKRPSWSDDLKDWEVYLDKADAKDLARYHLLRPDVVFVVTPDYTHAATAAHWLNKAQLVFVEKPFDSEIANVEELQLSYSSSRSPEIRGLDHYQFYASVLKQNENELRRHLGESLQRVEFYLTEARPIEKDRVRSLQHGLTLDLLPHLIALLSFFGDIRTIDEITVLEASQYEPLKATVTETGKLDDISKYFRNETASRVRFTFEDYSGNGFRVPCLAVVGKGFSKEVKYLEVTGTRHAIRVDFSRKENAANFPDYPFGALSFLAGTSSIKNARKHKETNDPYHTSKLHFMNDSQVTHYRAYQLDWSRYEQLLEDLFNGTGVAATHTLSLEQGREIVKALDRIWWAIQKSKPWSRYPLLEHYPPAPDW